MDYCVINEKKTITNLIVCEDDETALEFGALPWYEGAEIGGTYAPAHGPESNPAYTSDDLFSVLLGRKEEIST